MQVAHAVLGLILSSRFPAGTRLTERQIEQATGCSQAGARAALAELEGMGAVRIAERRGAAVIAAADAPAEDLQQVWDALLPRLEQLAGARYAPPPDTPPSDEARLADVWRALDRLGAAAGDDRLLEVLRRIALQRAIVCAVAAP